MNYFNLSNKRFGHGEYGKPNVYYLSEESVKEYIALINKKVKERCENQGLEKIISDDIVELINDLAGKRLNEK